MIDKLCNILKLYFIDIVYFMFWFCRWRREARTLEKEMWFWPTTRRQGGVISQTLLSSHRYRLFLLSLYTYLFKIFSHFISMSTCSFFLIHILLGMVSLVKLRWWTIVQFISPMLSERMKTCARSFGLWIDCLMVRGLGYFRLNWSPLKEEFSIKIKKIHEFKLYLWKFSFTWY